MSIIDTFTYLFRANTGDLKRGINDAQKSAGDLAAKLREIELAFPKSSEINLGTDDLASKLKEVEETVSELGETNLGSDNLAEKMQEARKNAEDLAKKMQDIQDSSKKSARSTDKLAGSLAKALGAIVSIGAAKSLISGTTESTFAISQQADAIDMSAESLAAWQASIRIAGGSAGEATQTLVGLRDEFVEMAKYGGIMTERGLMFQQLGLSARDMMDAIHDPMIAIAKLSEIFSSLGKTEQLFLGKKLGFDIATIQALSEGGDRLQGMIDRQQKLRRVTDDQVATNRLYRSQMTDLGLAWENFSRVMTAEAQPAIGAVAKAITSLLDMIVNHKVAIIGFFTALTAAIVALNVPLLLTSGYIAAIVAAAGVVALVAEDIYQIATGGESFIASGGGALSGMYDDLMGTSPEMQEFKAAAAQYQRPPLPAGAGFGDVMMASHDLMLGSGGGPASNVSNRTNSVKIDKIEVKTQATDPTGVARELNHSLRKSFRRALDQIDDGVAG